MTDYPTWIAREYDYSGGLARGSRGKTVRLFQEWLTLSGRHLVADGIFGPATEAAIWSYQEAEGLRVSGRGTKATFERLTEPLRRALAPIEAEERSLNELVVAYAEQHEREHPREVGGQNRGPWVRLYMKGNEGPDFPWCAGFVSFVVGQAAESFDAKLDIPYTFSCDVIAVEGKHRDRFLTASRLTDRDATAESGAVFLNRRTSTDWVHTGIVTRFDRETIETIEGNTNDSGGREGFEVIRRVRGYSKKDFVLI